jgi:transcriptional regulator with XRE-family HTH domain
MLVRLSFGTVIRDNRRKLGLTQEQVARRIGVSTPFVGHLESSKRRPSHHTVGLLADVLGLDESELFLTAYPEAAKLVGGRGENRDRFAERERWHITGEET